MSDSSLRTYLEERLRAAGIRIYSKEEWLKDMNAPTLTIGTTAFPLMQGETRIGFAVTTQMTLSQAVWLPRKSGNVATIAPTWSTVGLEVIRASSDTSTTWPAYVIARLDDRFAKAWMASHP